MVIGLCVADLQVPPENGQGSICPCDNAINVMVQLDDILQCYTKVFDWWDYLEGTAMKSVGMWDRHFVFDEWQHRTPLDSVKWDGRTLAKQQQRKDTRFSSLEKRINMSMVLEFLFTRTLRTLSWDVTQSPAGLSPSAWGQSPSTSQYYYCKPQHQTMMTMKQKNSITSSEHQRRTFLFCKRRLECKTMQGCLRKLARHLLTSAMTKQMTENSDSWSLPPFMILCGKHFWSSQNI